MNRWKRVLFFVVCLVLWSNAAAAEVCYSVFDEESGEMVYQTAWPLRENDEFLTGDNRRYRIEKVDGDTAQARLLETVKLSEIVRAAEERQDFFMKTAYAADKPLIGVYHTHNDESYIETDGEESSETGDGGIVKVGDAFAEALEGNGLAVLHSTESHIPHDNMAYERSRRTAAKIVKEHPAAIFDLHRDATPPEAYQGEINGEPVTKVQLVVGKYGPTGKQIEEYAMHMKAVSDEEYPGLVKGIFFAKGGDYNQDLHTHSMLLEVGSHTNDRHQAEKGISLFANVVPKVLGVKTAQAAPSTQKVEQTQSADEGGGAMKSAMYLLLAFLGGTIIYSYVSLGSVQEAKTKLNHFVHREFRDVFGGKKDDDKK